MEQHVGLGMLSQNRWADLEARRFSIRRFVMTLEKILSLILYPMQRYHQLVFLKLPDKGSPVFGE